MWCFLRSFNLLYFVIQLLLISWLLLWQFTALAVIKERKMKAVVQGQQGCWATWEKVTRRMIIWPGFLEDATGSPQLSYNCNLQHSTLPPQPTPMAVDRANLQRLLVHQCLSTLSQRANTASTSSDRRSCRPWVRVEDSSGSNGPNSIIPGRSWVKWLNWQCHGKTS